jgi:hypothetical protein
MDAFPLEPGLFPKDKVGKRKIINSQVIKLANTTLTKG